MRQAGRIVAQVLQLMGEIIAAGVTTADLDTAADALIREQGALPSFKGYHNFPASICTSINQQVVHGIPSKKCMLKPGDLISVDVGACYRGYHADSAATWCVGGAPRAHQQRLMDVTQQALAAAVEQAQAGHRLWDVISAIETTVGAAGYDVLRGYNGHGVGRELHEEPDIPNTLSDPRGRPPNVLLRPGMTLAIEPMVVEGSGQARILPDHWTVIAADGKLSAHFEHTVAIRNGAAEILTSL
jgi:methionyl aminopeptidase